MSILSKFGNAVLLSAIICGGMVIGSPSHAAEFKIKSGHVKFNQLRYFKKNSTGLDLGSYGRKRTPIGQRNYLEGGLRLNSVGPTNTSRNHVASSDSSFTGDFDVSAEQNGMNIDANAMIELLRQQHCTFARTSVADRNQLMALINDLPESERRQMKSNNMRVVFDILRIDECNLSNSSTVNAGAFVSTRKIGAAGGVESQRNNSFSFAEGSLIGYRLYKLDWKKREVVGMREDSQGLN